MDPQRIERPRESAAARAERDVDLRLIARVGEGDSKAFGELYAKYQPRLARFLGNVVRQPQIVEEVADDTLMVVWQRGSDFKGESKLSTWIFAIAYRKAMKALRRYDVPLEDHEAGGRPSLEAGPEELHGHRRLHRLLRGGDGRLVAGPPGRGRADLFPGSRLSRDRRDHGLPGRYGEDTHVLCPAPASAVPRGRSGGLDLGTDMGTILQLHDAHEQVQMLLPWHVNGTLDPAESALVETHLEACAECRADHAAEVALAPR